MFDVMQINDRLCTAKHDVITATYLGCIAYELSVFAQEKFPNTCALNAGKLSLTFPGKMCHKYTGKLSLTFPDYEC